MSNIDMKAQLVNQMLVILHNELIIDTNKPTLYRTCASMLSTTRKHAAIRMILNLGSWTNTIKAINRTSNNM